MSGPPMAIALPRPGPVLKAVLIAIVVLGILQSVLVNWIPGGEHIFLALACSTETVLHGQIWRLLTAGLLTSPTSLNHLLFTVLGLYFLSPDLERRWGSARFARFIALSVIVGFVTSIAVDLVAPPGARADFHPRLMFGTTAAITATALAWSKENADLQVRLFFFIPVSGKQFFWITIGLCLLSLIYPVDLPEGIGAPFGGLAVGLLLGGTPSALRALYLHLKLASIRRKAAAGPGATDVKPGSTRRGRGAPPPLRIVYGGLEEELRRRKPPKDKRHLN